MFSAERWATSCARVKVSHKGLWAWAWDSGREFLHTLKIEHSHAPSCVLGNHHGSKAQIRDERCEHVPPMFIQGSRFFRDSTAWFGLPQEVSAEDASLDDQLLTPQLLTHEQLTRNRVQACLGCRNVCSNSVHSLLQQNSPGSRGWETRKVLDCFDKYLLYPLHLVSTCPAPNTEC